MVKINTEDIGEITEKSRYNIQDLVNIMKILRSENGCSWDREQTHKSLTSGLIDETYEVVDAAKEDNLEGLKEELGDVLMLIVLNSCIAEENGEFNFDDICDGISKKMILRHPHVFKNLKVSGTDEILQNWDRIKRQEKKQTSYTDTLLAVPKAMPALLRAEKVQRRAKKAGFDWDEASGALSKVLEEANEVTKEVNSGNELNASIELGDLLFAVVNLSRFINTNPEEALNSATNKFINRFMKVEQLATKKGIDMQKASLEELDLLWDEVKREEKWFQQENLWNISIIFWRNIKMNKTELIAAVAEKAGIFKKDADKALVAVIDSIAAELKAGKKVQLVGFGTFEVKARAARNGINPKTGETIKIAASKAPAFKAGKALKEAIQ